MKEKLVLSVLVDNESGVLQRVASLFSRRAYNISSLTVSETEDPNFSRMTIETNTEPENFRQIKRQLLKLEIVEKDGVIELMPVAVYPKKYLDELRSEINEAKAKIAAGEQPVFDTVDALFEALDGADE